MYEQLAAFKKQEGHCRVPTVYASNPELGRWVRTQRAAKKKGELNVKRVALLEELGFVWDPYEADWQDMYAQLVAQQRQEGHCRVPRRSATNPKLGRWVMTQRAAKKKGELSEERVALLEELGFEWRLR
eukprot:jgi/Tetstr1/466516/TSEL_011023.t1